MQLSPFIYLPVRREANSSPDYWVKAKYLTFTKCIQSKHVINSNLKNDTYR